MWLWKLPYLQKCDCKFRLLVHINRIQAIEMIVLLPREKPLTIENIEILDAWLSSIDKTSYSRTAERIVSDYL